jgi:hypothetical protein
MLAGLVVLSAHALAALTRRAQQTAKKIKKKPG